MNLFLQSDSRPLHFVGIGGAGMSALALVALRRGVRVTGSDADISGCADLVKAGAVVAEGSAPLLVAEAGAVVASAAIPPGHPDLVEATRLGLPIVPRKQALAGLVAVVAVVALREVLRALDPRRPQASMQPARQAEKRRTVEVDPSRHGIARTEIQVWFVSSHVPRSLPRKFISLPECGTGALTGHFYSHRLRVSRTAHGSLPPDKSLRRARPST